MTTPEPQPVRFEAVVRGRSRELALSTIDALDLDRVPDPGDEIRLIVSPEDCTRLLAEGYEVRLQQAVPVRPLDPGLVASDSDAQAWFDDQVGE
jgi:hypothetical protein